MVLVELTITCVHDYMVVTVKVTKIYGKMNFNRRGPAITALPTTPRRELGGTDTGCVFQFTYCLLGKCKFQKKFSLFSVAYAVRTHWNYLIRTIPMCSFNICHFNKRVFHHKISTTSTVSVK